MQIAATGGSPSERATPMIYPLLPPITKRQRLERTLASLDGGALIQINQRRPVSRRGCARLSQIMQSQAVDGSEHPPAESEQREAGVGGTCGVVANQDRGALVPPRPRANSFSRSATFTTSTTTVLQFDPAAPRLSPTTA